MRENRAIAIEKGNRLKVHEPGFDCLSCACLVLRYTESQSPFFLVGSYLSMTLEQDGYAEQELRDRANFFILRSGFIVRIPLL